jgi:CheY-like chemotaxis protein
MSKIHENCEILIAEDNVADVALVREALKEHDIDCTLHVMKDGGQVIAFLDRLDANPKTARLDLMLLDMHLPRRDGDEILRRLRSTEHHAQTPVIVMTASDAPDDRATAAKHAAVHYFRKPTSLTEYMELGAIVRTVLGRGKKEACGGEL